jgi:hypothetical protein
LSDPPDQSLLYRHLGEVCEGIGGVEFNSLIVDS